jgi:hypothetical protein
MVAGQWWLHRVEVVGGAYSQSILCHLVQGSPGYNYECTMYAYLFHFILCDA